MKKIIKAGATDQTIDIFVQNSSSTTGAGLTGLVYNSASLVCYYRKGATGSATALTLATQTVGGAHSDGGFVEIDATNMPGMYRLDLSDTIIASAGSVSLMLKGATNMAPLPIELQVVAVNLEDSVRMGLTALPNAAADAAGGLPISDAGALDLDAKIGALTYTVAGKVDANATHFAGTAYATALAAEVDAVWDEVLTAGTHNVGNSAGRRLRTLQTGGNYEGGMVWVDTVNGVAGTTVDENGVVTNPVSTWADALTLSAAIPLNAFHIANGSTVTLTAASSSYTLEGHEWTLALGGQAVAATMVINGSVSGTGTGGNTEFEDCIFGIASLESMQAYNCSFTATTSGGFTMSAAGDYRFINCQSGVAGSGAPLFTLGTGVITAEFRRWSGGIQIAGISADDTLTIGGELGTVTLSGADGTVEIRGSYKAIVDNRTGSPTLNLNGAFKAADVASILADTAVIGATGEGLTTLATQASVNTIDDFLDTEIAAIKDKTDSLTFTKAGEIDANIQSVNGVTVNGDGAGTPMGV